MFKIEDFFRPSGALFIFLLLPTALLWAKVLCPYGTAI